MECTLTKQIQERFLLETSLLRFGRRRVENEAALRQAKFDLREANAREAEYRGSIRSFLDRMKGAQEQRETELRHAAAAAKQRLADTQREKTLIEQSISQTEERLAALPCLDALRAAAQGETLTEYCRLDALYCIEVLEPMLGKNHADLFALREKQRGNNIGKFYTEDEAAQIATDPVHSADACKPFLTRLRAALEHLQLPFGTWRFYENPAGFLWNVAAEHNRRERLNDALDQVEELQKQLQRLKIRVESSFVA